MRTTCKRGYADLLRAFAVVPEEHRTLAAGFLGFEPGGERASGALENALRDITHDLHDAVEKRQKRRSEGVQKKVLTESERSSAVSGQARQDASFSLLMPVGYRHREREGDVPDHWLFRLPPLAPAEWRTPKNAPLPTKTALMPWTRLWPFLRRSLSQTVPGPRIHVPSLVDKLARLETPKTVPKLSIRRWHADAWVVEDRSADLVPFWDDVDGLIDKLTPLRGRTGRVKRVSDGMPPDAYPPEGAPVLVLGDLGQNSGDRERIAQWVQYAERLKKRQSQRAALVPCARERWTRQTADAWTAALWDEGTPPPLSDKGLRPLYQRDHETIQRGKDKLRTVMAPFPGVTPALLRGLRMLLPSDYRSVSLEYDMLNSQDLERHLDSVAMPPETAKSLHPEFDALPSDIKERIVALMAEHHVGQAAPVQAKEILLLSEYGAPVAADRVDWARRIMQRAIVEIKDALQQNRPALPGMSRHIKQEVVRACEDLKVETALAVLLSQRKRNLGNVEQPIHLNEEQWDIVQYLISEVETERSIWRLSLQSERLHAERVENRMSIGAAFPLLGENHQAKSEPGFEVSPLKTGRPMGKHRPFGAFLDVTVLTGEEKKEIAWNLFADNDLEGIREGEQLVVRSVDANQRWGRMPPPPWADCYAWDKHGIYAEFEINKARFKLRWIPPGSFNMGSPKDELGRWDPEGPVHRVVIENGFWLGETPVTQGQYAAVTGENPSEFKDDGANRPVEKVDWHQARKFCNALTAQLEGLNDLGQFRLPSEAEWEYACRAGSEAPLYNDKPLTSKEGRCPNLDELAWYEKNADGKTHPVKQKAVNPWGLYDILGNVWEWCEDPWHDSYEGAPVDGKAWVDDAEAGLGRVLRGGAWLYDAWWCRAASRYRRPPDSRWYYRGFRVALAPSETGGIPPFEQASGGGRSDSAPPRAESRDRRAESDTDADGLDTKSHLRMGKKRMGRKK